MPKNRPTVRPPTVRLAVRAPLSKMYGNKTRLKTRPLSPPPNVYPGTPRKAKVATTTPTSIIDDLKRQLDACHRRLKRYTSTKEEKREKQFDDFEKRVFEQSNESKKANLNDIRRVYERMNREIAAAAKKAVATTAQQKPKRRIVAIPVPI